MRSVTGFVLVSILLVGIAVSCVGIMGLAYQRAGEVADSTTSAAQARRAEAEAEEAEAEAEAAEAEAEAVEAEAERARAEAERAQAEVERIRAEGERAEAMADAYATRRLAEEGARAIRRQGRLLALSQAQLLVMGVVLGAAIIVIAALAWALVREGRGDDDE